MSSRSESSRNRYGRQRIEGATLSSQSINDVGCGCYCMPPAAEPNSIQQDMYLTAFRVGVIQVCVDLLLCLAAVAYAHLIPVLGWSLVCSFTVSVIGASCAVCCCPTRYGWTLAFRLCLVGFIIRVLNALAGGAVMLTVTDRNASYAVTLCKYI